MTKTKAKTSTKGKTVAKASAKAKATVKSELSWICFKSSERRLEPVELEVSPIKSPHIIWYDIIWK